MVTDTLQSIEKLVSGSLQVKKGYYYAVLNMDKQKWISTGIKCTKGNKRLAEQALEQIRIQYTVNQKCEKESEKTKDKTLFSDAILRWVEKVKKKQVKTTTYAAYARNVRIIADYFAQKGTLLEAITFEEIEDFYEWLMTERNDKAETVHRYHTLINQCINYHYKRTKRRNPALDVELPTDSEDFQPGFYSEAEVELLIQKVKGTLLEIPVTFALCYGLRRSEALGIRWSSVDFDNKRFTINHIVTNACIDNKQILVQTNSTKNNQIRSYPMTPPIEVILLEKWNNIQENRRLFKSAYLEEFADYINVNEIGDLVKPEYVTAKFRSTLEKFGLRRIRFHDLRHTCASLLLKDEPNLKVIQEYLGHKVLQTTERYLHLVDSETKIRATDIMQGKIFGT